jgi:MFS family permease
VIWSNGATGLLGRPPSEPAATQEHDPGGGSARTPTPFVSVLLLMLSTGWVANHFVALMPLISDRQHLGAATLDVIFGIYALGLIPGLLIGGRASDALGRPSVALTGSATALVGTLAMLASQQADVLLAGRLIVGIGVGLAMTSCTAWASDLKGPAGAATAGAVLIAGFAVGPLAGGLIARAGQAGVGASFGVAAAIVVAAIVVTVMAVRRADLTTPAAGSASEPAPVRQGTAWALGWAMPLAPWVFASATLGFVTIPTRLHTALAAPMAAGTAALIVNGISGVIQVIARAANWGRHTGTAGALLAALGYALTALAPPAMTPQLALPLFLILGCASGLCLRAGLIDLEAFAPQHLRGALVGAFYVVTYVGFGLPLILTTVGATASASILALMSALALAAAVSRAVRLRRIST